MRTTLQPLVLLFALLLGTLLVSAEPAPEVQPLLDAGKALEQKFELRQAEAVYREALAVDPACIRARCKLASVLADLGEHPGALRELDRAAEIDPERPEPYTGRGSMALKLYRRKEAAEWYEEALVREPGYVPALCGLALVRIEDREYEKADELISRAEALKPGTREPLATRSEYCFRTGDMTGSAKLLRKMLELNQDDLTALGRLSNGFQENDRGPYLPPDVSPGYRAEVQRGKEAYRRLDYAAARTIFAALDGEGAEDGRPAFYLGIMALREDDAAQAVARLRAAVDREPEHPLFANSLASAYRLKVELQRPEFGGGDDPTDRATPLLEARPVPEVKRLPDLVRSWDRLLPPEQAVLRRAAAPVAHHLGMLADREVYHDILDYDEGVCEAKERQYLLHQRTTDGRRYSMLRGLGGRHAGTGLEDLRDAARLGFDTFAHELAHQVHSYALSEPEKRTVKGLYDEAVKKDLCLDYYAASNEFEYFGQGYEAFVSPVKSPYRHSLRRHTRAELKARDPALYRFILDITDTEEPDPEYVDLGPALVSFYEWAKDETALERVRKLLAPLEVLEPAGTRDR